MFLRRFHVYQDAATEGGAAGAPAAPAAPAPAPAPAPAAPAPAAEWFGGVDPAYVKIKGWSSAEDAIKSYQGAEKLIGRDPNSLMVLPRPDDPEGVRSVYTKLGLPEKPEKYEFDDPTKHGLAKSEDYEKWARETFHRIGVPAPLAKELTAAHNAYGKAQLEAQQAAYDQKLAADKAALQQEWRGGFERQMAAAQGAARALGLSEDMVAEMERALGYAGVMKQLAAIGQKIGEDKFVTGDVKTGFGAMTPQEAAATWDQKKLDPNFIKALTDRSHPGHKAAKDEQSRLFAIAYPQ